MIRQYHYLGNPYAFVAIDAPASRTYALSRADSRLTAVEERIRRLLGAPGEKAQA